MKNDFVEWSKKDETRDRKGRGSKQTNKPADRDATNKKAITPLT
jgi:hypothetical protein